MPIENPGTHPLPPSDLSQRSLPIIPWTEPLFRVHQSKYAPLHFGHTGECRFDAPKQEYGILYLGSDDCVAFRETVGSLSQRRIVTRRLLETRCLATVESVRPLQLVDLTGAGLTAIDADGRLTTGDYQISQQWSLAFWHHPSQVDGLYYRSRRDPSRYCFALYDRINPQLAVSHTINFLDHSFQARLAEILNLYQYAFLG